MNLMQNFWWAMPASLILTFLLTWGIHRFFDWRNHEEPKEFSIVFVVWAASHGAGLFLAASFYCVYQILNPDMVITDVLLFTEPFVMIITLILNITFRIGPVTRKVTR
jgi:hypothetical protein